MKLKIYRSQSESSSMLGGKKFNYTLRIVAEITDEEAQMLNKYGYLSKMHTIDPELSSLIVATKEVKGQHQVSLSQLQSGVEWSSSYLPVDFVNIPAAIYNLADGLLGAAMAREMWGGEDVVEIE